jgi:hypothetical protein
MATPTTLPATFTAGQVLTAAQMNDLRGAFRILQVVSATTTTQVISSSTTYADTGLTATITPSDASSKILVAVSHPGNYKSPVNANNAIAMRLVRGSTTIAQMSVYAGYTAIADTLYFSISHVYLDSPATTSATTYKTTFANNSATSDVRVQSDSTQSSIILLEVSA